MAQSPDATGETRLSPVRALRSVFSGVGQLLQAADRFREEEAERLQAEAQATAAPPPDGGPLEEEPESPKLLKITGNSEQPRTGSKAAKASKSANAAKPAKVSANGTKRADKKSGRPAPQESRFRSLDSTGNVRILTDQDKADLAEDEMDRSQLIRPTIRLTEIASPTGYQLPSYQTPSYTTPSYTTPAYPRYEPPDYFSSSPQSAPAALPIEDYDGLSIASLRARLRTLDPAQLRELVDYETSHADRADVVTMFENRITKLESAE